MNNPPFDSHRGRKVFSLPRVVPRFPLLGLTPSGLFMGSISTLIYTAELILCFINIFLVFLPGYKTGKANFGWFDYFCLVFARLRSITSKSISMFNSKTNSNSNIELELESKLEGLLLPSCSGDCCRLCECLFKVQEGDKI